MRVGCDGADLCLHPLQRDGYGEDKGAREGKSEYAGVRGGQGGCGVSVGMSEWQW